MVEESELIGFEAIENEKKEIVKEIHQTVELLRNAKKPLVIAGNGIKLADGIRELYQFLEAEKIPVITTWKTIDMFDENYPLYVGHPGIMGDRGANKILQEADLLISIGSRLDTSITAFNDKKFAKNAKKVIVDIDINEINRMEMSKDVIVECDAKHFIVKLIEQLQNAHVSSCYSSERDEWCTYCKKLREKYPTVTAAHKNTGNYVSAYYFVDELCRLLDENDVIVPESSGGAGEITYQAFKLKYGQKMKNAAGLGSMGFGLPYAIGSCIANDKKRTILINGDGAFQLNIQELETLHRLNLPVKIFIWDNNGYASIRAMQNGNFAGHFVASSETSGLTFPDTAAIAGAYGLKTYKLNNNTEMIEKLPDILNETGMSLCILSTSPEETVWPRVKARILPDGGMVSGDLEDMWPYEQK